MSGAGAGSLAFAKESSFMGSLKDPDADGSPEYWSFGRNPELTELDLGNQLQRLSEAGVIESVDSIAGKVDGAVAVDAVVSKDTFQDVLDVVFNDAGGGFTHGTYTTAAIFVGIDYIGGTAERELVGCTPTDFSIEYDHENNTVSYSVTFLYADETLDSTITPSNVIKPTDNNDVPFHGFSLDIDATTVSKLQTASLSFSNISKYQWGPSRTPVEAVAAKPETSLEAEAIYGGASRLELAYGGANATSPQDSLSNVTATVTLTVAGTTVATFNLPKVKPEQYSWNNVIGEEDMVDSTQFHVNGGVSVS